MGDMNNTPMPIIFYHVSRKEFFKGVIMETDHPNGMYRVLYMDVDNVHYKVSVKYNNCIIMDMSFHPVKCEDKIPTT